MDSKYLVIVLLAISASVLGNKGNVTTIFDSIIANNTTITEESTKLLKRVKRV